MFCRMSCRTKPDGDHLTHSPFPIFPRVFLNISARMVKKISRSLTLVLKAVARACNHAGTESRSSKAIGRSLMYRFDWRRRCAIVPGRKHLTINDSSISVAKPLVQSQNSRESRQPSRRVSNQICEELLPE